MMLAVLIGLFALEWRKKKVGVLTDTVTCDATAVGRPSCPQGSQPVRNVFDQYSQTENRVSHALLTALNEDRVLLGSFLRELVGVTPQVPPRLLTLYSQRYPDEMALAEEAERRGIPDGWIFDIDAEWCAFIEAKVQATLSLEQLARHRRAAERLGFRTIIAIAITSGRDLPRQAPCDPVLLRWRDVYEWLVRYRARDWAAKAAEYLEIVEARLIETEKFSEGTLTMFAGFPFSHKGTLKNRSVGTLLAMLGGVSWVRHGLAGAVSAVPAS